MCTHNVNLSKNKKNIKNFLLLKKILCILHGQFFLMKCPFFLPKSLIRGDKVVLISEKLMKITEEPIIDSLFFR